MTSFDTRGCIWWQLSAWWSNCKPLRETMFEIVAVWVGKMTSSSCQTIWNDSGGQSPSISTELEPSSSNHNPAEISQNSSAHHRSDLSPHRPQGPPTALWRRLLHPSRDHCTFCTMNVTKINLHTITSSILFKSITHSSLLFIRRLWRYHIRYSQLIAKSLSREMVSPRYVTQFAMTLFIIQLLHTAVLARVRKRANDIDRNALIKSGWKVPLEGGKTCTDSKHCMVLIRIRHTADKNRYYKLETTTIRQFITISHHRSRYNHLFLW